MLVLYITLAAVTADKSCVYIPFTRASKTVHAGTQQRIYNKVYRTGISGHTSAYLNSTQALS